MSLTYRLNKHCPICDTLLSDKNKTGFCNHHRDRTGKNNPFYGKTHSIESLRIIKEKCKKMSKELWKDSEYRNKIIKAISKPRIDSFKKEQSERMIQWYKDNPDQRKIRKERMKLSWKEGAITETEKHAVNRSKIENRLYEDIKDSYESINKNFVIKSNEGSWYFPDLLINNKFIIEVYGDYWHANPKKYKASNIVHHFIMADDIWAHDKKRKENLEKLGYIVLIVWVSDYKKHRDAVLLKIKNRVEKF